MNQNGRNINCILGDGICLFRALSHQLYVTEKTCVCIDEKI